MKKLIAGLMTGLMALLTVTTPALAASTVGGFPAFLAGSDGKLNAYVVVGSSAATSDVVGAVDIAVRLPEVGKTEVPITGTSTSSVVGTVKDNIALSELLSVNFPSGAILKTAHYSGLKDASYSWSGSPSTTYEYREQVNIAGVQMRHDLATSNVNGTEKMVVETGDIKYQFVFEKDLTHGGVIAAPNYTYPINIKLLGQDFAIVGSDTSRIMMLHGSVGTATSTSGVTYGDYTIYAVTGVNAGWATLRIDDANGNKVEELTIDQGSSKSSTTAGITIQVTNVRALTYTGEAYVDVVIGPTTEGTTKTYDISADVTSSGTSSDRFPGETLWGIQVGTNALTAAASFATAGKITNGDVIEVVYKPTSTQYLAAGESIDLPNGYATLSFDGWNTDTFATITVEKLSGTLSAYNSSDTTQAFGNLDGIKISSDVPGTIVSGANNGYSEAYLLFNYTRTFTDTGEEIARTYDVLPVMLGYKDTSTDKILVSGVFVLGNATVAETEEYVSKLLFPNLGYNATHVYEFNHSIKLSYGNSADQPFHMYIAIKGRLIDSIAVGKHGATTINMTWTNTSLPSATNSPSFRLGATASSAETAEIKATTEAVEYDAGKKTQEIVTDSGIILLNTESNGASDRVVFKIPYKDLKAVVAFGSKTGTQTTTSTGKYWSYPSIPVTSTIAKLDSEMSGLKTAKHVILVGGPCANTLVAELAAEGKFSYTCDTWPGRNFGLVQVIDDGFATGKVVLVVAGTRAEDTRVAAAAVQQYDTKLAGKTTASVEVTGTVGAPVVG